MTATILRADARNLPLPDASVDLIVTSPPYFALRSYTDTCNICLALRRDGQDPAVVIVGYEKHVREQHHYAGQIGAEPTPAEYIASLIACTREWVRVLKPSGSLFVNLGDKYSTGNSGQSGMAALGERYRGGGHTDAKAKQRSCRVAGMQPKSLLLLPERYRIAAVDELGLIARAVLVWSKPNGLPESVTDRVRRSHEDWVHLTKLPRYFSAVDEIREQHTMRPQRRPSGRPEDLTPRLGQPRQAWSTAQRDEPGVDGHPLGKLPGSVWEIATEPLKVPAELGVDHFAAFPTEWPRRIIQGWSPSGICTACSEGRRPVTDKGEHRMAGHGGNYAATAYGAGRHGTDSSSLRTIADRTITGEACACPDATAPTRPAVVLDPCGGTGTTALVASVLGRHGISADMSADYCRLARWRTNDPAQRAKAARVSAPPKQLDGQADLFGEWVS